MPTYHESVHISGGTVNGPVTYNKGLAAPQPSPPGDPAGCLTVGVLVALNEEFRHYQNVFGKDSAVRPGPDGTAQHVKHLTWAGARPVRLVSQVIGQKGPEHATQAAARLLASLRPDVLVSIGLSGGLSTDVSLGDVVIADTVTSFLARGKVIDGQPGQAADVQAAGDPYRADKWLGDRAAGLADEAPGLYQEWRARATAIQRRSFPPATAGSVRVLRGDLAAGPLVIASPRFRRWLLGHNRHYLAVDMESGGVAAAVWGHARATSRLLVIRAISDLAGLDKARVEQESDLRIRGAAMTCATRYLEAVLHQIATLHPVDGS